MMKQVNRKKSLNLRSRAVSLFGRVFGSKSFQPLFEKAQLLLLAGMNVGGATLNYNVNGEKEVLKLIKRSYKPDYHFTIFDVGAHQGDYALVVKDVFKNSSTAYCFEPSEDLFQELEKNLSNTDFGLFQLALSDEAASLALFTSDDRIPTLLGNAFEITGQKLVSQEKVRSIRLDDFCKNNEIEHIDFLKIDVEGFELKVLNGAGDLIQKGAVDFVQFEFGQHCIASRTFMRDFFTLLGPSYRIFRILRNGLVELKTYRPQLEQFVSATNYLAISRQIS